LKEAAGAADSVRLWAYQNGVKIDFSRPGKLTDNAFVESFNGTFRAECLRALPENSVVSRGHGLAYMPISHSASSLGSASLFSFAITAAF
jgi:transposase InsO family protein